MKVFISADIEGVSGVVHQEHTMRDGREHDRAREWMTREVNAAIRGALDAGASEIVVNDSHGSMRNIILEDMLPEADLIIGSPKKLSMMEGIDETFDAVLFLGYHAQMGENGVLNHTFNSRVIKAIRINGVAYGELGINALIASHYHVPVVFASGCQWLGAEAKSVIPNIETAIVKHTITRHSARNLHPVRVETIIREKAYQGINKRETIKPFTVEAPYYVEVEFLDTGIADAADISPVVERINPLTIGFTSNDMLTCYQMIRIASYMGDSIYP